MGGQQAAPRLVLHRGNAGGGAVVLRSAHRSCPGFLHTMSCSAAQVPGRACQVCGGWEACLLRLWRAREREPVSFYDSTSSLLQHRAGSPLSMAAPVCGLRVRTQRHPIPNWMLISPYCPSLLQRADAGVRGSAAGGGHAATGVPRGIPPAARPPATWPGQLAARPALVDGWGFVTTSAQAGNVWLH